MPLKSKKKRRTNIFFTFKVAKMQQTEMVLKPIPKLRISIIKKGVRKNGEREQFDSSGSCKSYG